MNIISEQPRVPQMPVRNLSKFERELRVTAKPTKIVKQSVKTTPFTRTSVSRKSVATPGYIVLDFTVVFKTPAQISIKRIPAEHRTPNYIKNGRARKDVLRYMPIYENYELQKQNNLNLLVAELESEQRKQENKSNYERRNIESALVVSGLANLQDMILEEDANIVEIDKSMVEHFKNLQAQMIQHYTPVDLYRKSVNIADQAFRAANVKCVVVQSNAEKFAESRNKSKYYLHQIVNSYNNQRR